MISVRQRQRHFHFQSVKYELRAYVRYFWCLNYKPPMSCFLYAVFIYCLTKAKVRLLKNYTTIEEFISSLHFGPFLTLIRILSILKGLSQHRCSDKLSLHPRIKNNASLDIYRTLFKHILKLHSVYAIIWDDKVFLELNYNI